MRTQTRARLVLTGLTPLVLNNIRLADPTDEYHLKMKEITSKRTKSPEELEQKELLQWAGSLYLDADDRIVFPGRNLYKALREAAPTFKLGPAIDRGGAAIVETEAVLEYDGPKDRKSLYEDPRFRFRTIVNGSPTKNKAMVPAMRPIFPVWSLSFTAIVFADILGWADFLRIVDAAGAQGIGNARKLGYGRFDAQVTEL